MRHIVDPRAVVIKIASILRKVKIPYFITGGFAVSVWGRPRATFDIDVVVELIEPKVEVLAGALRKIYKAGYIDEISAVIFDLDNPFSGYWNLTSKPFERFLDYH